MNPLRQARTFGFPCSRMGSRAHLHLWQYHIVSLLPGLLLGPPDSRRITPSSVRKQELYPLPQPVVPLITPRLRRDVPASCVALQIHSILPCGLRSSSGGGLKPSGCFISWPKAGGSHPLPRQLGQRLAWLPAAVDESAVNRPEPLQTRQMIGSPISHRPFRQRLASSACLSRFRALSKV
jgi:hypothetical protein